MNQLRDMFAILMSCIYHLSLFGIAAYLVYWKDASAWIFIMPLLMMISFKTKDDKK